MGKSGGCVADSRLGVQIRERGSRGRRVLSPPVHAACHDHLWGKLFDSSRGVADRFPLLEEGEEGEGQPKRSDGIRMQAIIEVFFLQVIEVGLFKRFCRLLGRLFELAY